MTHPTASSTTPSTSPPQEVEIAIVGGGPAGLSAALVLGRARRNVVVIDAGDPGHFAADAVHGFLGQENVAPRELRRRVWEQMEPFDVELLEGAVAAGRALAAPAGLQGARGAQRAETGFELTLASGEVVRAAVVVLAGGLRYGVREVDGLADLWGTRLFHCPFCHGWEVGGKRVGVLAPPEILPHLHGMLGMWTEAPQAILMASAGGLDPSTVADEAPVAQRVRLDGEDVVVDTVGGGELRLDALFAPPVLSPHDDLPQQLGVPHEIVSPMAPEPLGLKIGPMGATSVPGVFAAGDLAGEMPSVANAVAGGARAAAGIVRWLAGQG